MVIMKSNDIQPDRAPSRYWEHSRLSRSISNDQRGILGTVLRNGRYLE